MCEVHAEVGWLKKSFSEQFDSPGNEKEDFAALIEWVGLHEQAILFKTRKREAVKIRETKSEAEFKAQNTAMAETVSPEVELVWSVFLASVSGGDFLARDGLWALVYKKSGTPSALNSCFFVVLAAAVW